MFKLVFSKEMNKMEQSQNKKLMKGKFDIFDGFDKILDYLIIGNFLVICIWGIKFITTVLIEFIMR